MELFLGITCLVIALFLFFVILTVQKDSNDIAISTSTSLGAITMLLFIIGLVLISEHCVPSITPIDVYRGKTTLEITYRDGIAIDSVVVWKEGVK
jgi:hypothetical protein